MVGRTEEKSRKTVAAAPPGSTVAARVADVSDAIAFLASADARFVNGVQLPVDGGTPGLLGPAPHVLSTPGGENRELFGILAAV
ncbi:hypothetical protein GCM10017744_026900 [Streptomyces antimycoticus]